MNEVEWVVSALGAAAAAFEERMPESPFLFMVGAALASVALLAVMLPRSR